MTLPSFDHARGDPIENDITVGTTDNVIIVEGLYTLLGGFLSTWRPTSCHMRAEHCCLAAIAAVSGTSSQSGVVWKLDSEPSMSSQTATCVQQSHSNKLLRWSLMPLQKQAILSDSMSEFTVLAHFAKPLEQGVLLLHTRSWGFNGISASVAAVALSSCCEFCVGCWLDLQSVAYVLTVLCYTSRDVTALRPRRAPPVTRSLQSRSPGVGFEPSWMRPGTWSVTWRTRWQQ